MALINCEECGKQVSSKAKSCPNCGFNVERNLTNKSQTGCLTNVGLLSMMLFFGIILYEALMPIQVNDQQNSTPLDRKLTESEKYEQRTGVSIPEDLEIELLEAVIDPPFKRAVKTRLSRPVNKEVLTLIAIQIKQMRSDKFNNTFIDYYLPGMDTDYLSWASAHFNPALTVAINDWALEALEIERDGKDEFNKSKTK